MEIDFSLFARQPASVKKASGSSPLKLASLSYISIVVLSLVIAAVFKFTGLFSDVWLAAILFATVSLGVVIATLKERELLSKPYGQTLLLIAVLGEVVPMLALTVYAAVFGNSSHSLWLIFLIFVAAAILFTRFRKFFSIFERINKSTTQLDIRLAFFLIVTLVTIAESVGAESIFGAFIAGIVLKLLQPHEDTRDKLDSFGYGLLIPIFFIMSGVTLNIPQLLSNRKTLILIPLIFIAYLLAKAIVYFILKKRFSSTNALAGNILNTATITLVLAVLKVAKSMHAVTSQQSGAFILAAIITCVLGPLAFNHFYKPEPEALHKTVVHFIGTNLSTIPVAQQLAKGAYDIKMYTDKQKNYSAYNSQVNVELLSSLETQDVVAQHVFDTDILVLGHYDAMKNYRLALAAKKMGVNRVIARFEDRNILNNSESELEEAGVEVYSTPEANISILRSLIEVPSTLQILQSTESGIYEVTVNNQRYAGTEIRNLPFIGEITISQIFRHGNFIKPSGDTAIELSDRLVFTGSKEQAPVIRAALGKLNKN
ncbi:sodium hydrogen exchanger [Paucilactobacillus suebicus DSM 5007 = KCTC 3549]|uniref:Sodium hydrogen exchanger n=2 Tax=Paucilactobacillus suebicus TaxID=152335 RepID=A0A0R1VW73_9LACO|nr:sodium hydrogen exchanger [Paucilactobacillus suebicus DSM 5007 = KCTC 3549]